jgi:probable F420-dependent oxidoreductase
VRFWQSMAFSEPTEYPALARDAEDAGMHGVMLSDHVFYPQELRTRYPYSPDGRPIWDPSTPWPDVWVATGAMAAVTTKLQFATNVYVAPARDPFTVAKAVGTASVLSSGRVSLGLAAGWMREEFDGLGQAFSNRGARLDEMIQVLRSLWSPGWSEYHGRYYDFDALMMEPKPAAGVPIWCGGDSEPALRRAAQHCDGWVGNPYLLADAESKVTRLRQLLRQAGRDGEPFEIIVGVLDPPSLDVYRRLEDLGVSGLVCIPWLAIPDRHMRDVAMSQKTTSRARKQEALRVFADEYIAKLG